MKFRSHIVLTIMCCALAALVAISGCTFLPLSGFGSSAQTSEKPGTNAVNVVPAAYGTTSPQTGAGTCGSGKILCNGHCSDTQVDIGDCGGCGLACPANAYCEKGQCYCKDGYAATSDGRCIPATTTAPTTSAQGGNTGCPTGLIPCPDGYCYCGTCGTQCMVGQTCTNGVCVGGTPQVTQQVQGTNSACSVTFGTYNPEVNAGIYLDNSYTGHTTPYTMPVQPGSHSYTLKKAGYNDYSDTFTVTAPAAGGICTRMFAIQMIQTNPTPACSGTMCNGICTNTQTDPNNCGTCNTKCSYSCVNGNCNQPRTMYSNWGGHWTGHTTSDFGMDLTQSGSSVTGTYSGGQGRISGTASGNTLSGTASWNNGAPFNFQFTMAADLQSFTGSWSDTGGSHPWNGKR